MHERLLNSFVGLLALIGVISTNTMIGYLRRAGALIAHFVVGVRVATCCILLARRYRGSILALPPWVS